MRHLLLGLLLLIGIGRCAAQFRFNNTYMYDEVTNATTYHIEEDTVYDRFVSTLLYAYNNSEYRFGIQSIDADGTFDFLNTTVLDFSYSYGPYPMSFLQTQDGGFVLAAGFDGPDIIKWNSDLEVEWMVEGENGVQQAYEAVVELPNGELLALHVYGDRPDGASYFDIERFSSSGEFIDSFPYDQQGNGSFSTATFKLIDGFVYLGLYRLYSINNVYAGYGQLAKIDWETQEVIWTRVWENGIDTTTLGVDDVVLTSSNAYKMTFIRNDSLYGEIVGSNFLDYPYNTIHICDLDPETGDTLNVKRIGDAFVRKSVYDMEATDDGGVILLHGYLGIEFPGYHNFLTKLDSDDEIEWTMEYYPEGITDYGNSTMELRDVEPTADGGYLICGYALDHFTIDDGIPGKPWIIKTDACGQVIAADCTTNGIQEQLSQPLTIFPNPAFNTVSLRSSSGIHNVCIYAQDGRLVREFTITSNQELSLDISDLTSGVYFIRSVGSSQVPITQRLVVAAN